MMKPMGIVRKIDELGRIVLPKELRDTMNLPSGTPMEIFVNDRGEIMLKKYVSGCRFCGSMENLVHYAGEYVCHTCIDNLAKTQTGQQKEGEEAKGGLTCLLQSQH